MLGCIITIAKLVEIGVLSSKKPYINWKWVRCASDHWPRECQMAKSLHIQAKNSDIKAFQKGIFNKIILVAVKYCWWFFIAHITAVKPFSSHVLSYTRDYTHNASFLFLFKFLQRYIRELELFTIKIGQFSTSFIVSRKR